MVEKDDGLGGYNGGVLYLNLMGYHMRRGRFLNVLDDLKGLLGEKVRIKWVNVGVLVWVWCGAVVGEWVYIWVWGRGFFCVERFLNGWRFFCF